MTVVVRVGRRVPQSWFRRTAVKVKGLMTFQENIWQIITQSFIKAKRKANADGRLQFVLQSDREREDLHFYLEWKTIFIRGTEEMEEEEYKDSLKMYDKLSAHFKKDFPKDERLSKQFKTKVMSMKKVDECYKEGYGVVKEQSISDKLLEMGILTHIDWKKDFDERVPYSKMY